MLYIDRDTINTAEKLIRPHIRKTPIIEMHDSEIGIDSVEVVLKLELFQHSGSFKPRGAFTNMLMRDVPSSGVVAASGGNHGAAVAYAAMKLNKPAKIFVPTVASPAKMNRIRSYGADLVVTGERYAESLLASEDWANKTGALPIHAYDQPETLLGQGTVAAEFHDQDPNLDTLLVAVGGGGLIGGMAAWYAG
ncbi:pyridoxal-phosphate dependent enzyme, partial [bacterium]|nr:pyridoxal-phosphate dependent enzyme [bacterium]